MEQQFTDEQRREMHDIMDNTFCKLDFLCYKSSLENICKAEFDTHGLVCKINKMPTDKSTKYLDCRFRLYIGYSNYICRCPLRIYIAKNLNR